jgi:hypothetical protein
MTEQEAFLKIKANPASFFKHYPINCVGNAGAHTANAANLRYYYLTKRDGSASGHTKTGHYGATRPGSVLPFMTHNISSFRIDTFNAHGSKSIHAYSVPMIPSDKAGFAHNALDAYLATAGGDEFIITGQLSGCCFCWLPVAGGLWCAHIQPRSPYNGVQLHNLLHTSGRFAGMPHAPISTFGRNDYASHANVIGVKTNAGWQLFAQTTSDQGRTITGAMQLYPQRRAL